MDRTALIRGESDLFGEVLAGADPSARVPTCPDWSAVDLLRHLTQVHRFWAAVIGDRLTEAQVEELQSSRPPLPDDRDELLVLRREATADLLAALGGRDPAEPAWSWFPADQTVGFTWRMQTHEATMHRVDAELTAGRPLSRIDPDVAAEGVDHVVDVMWAWAPADAERRPTGTVRLEATDTGRSWLINTFRWSGQAWGQTFADQIGTERVGAGDARATVSGRAEDLDLLVWKRADRHVSRVGDPEVLAEFQAAVDAGIP